MGSHNLSEATTVFVVWALVTLSFLVFEAASAQRPGLPDAPKPKHDILQTTENTETGWPRTFTSDINSFAIYQPQLDKWDGNFVDLYCAVELKTITDAPSKYGVVWIQARTEVDKVNRLVTLDQAKITKVKFPAASDKEPELTTLLQTKLPNAAKTISLDRLEAALEAEGEVIKGVEVKNDPPKVIIANGPSVLVLIDGPPRMAGVPGLKLRTVVNTRAIILYDDDKQLYFLRVEDWWLQAKALEGSWEYAKKLPGEMQKAEEVLASHNKAQSTAQGGEGKQGSSLKANGTKVEFASIPSVHVAFEPTEMIETKSEPSYKPVSGTRLEYISNTTGNVFRLAGEYYVLLSGRWFTATMLAGPWTFVSAADMPPDFAKIPGNSPKATVLASVPGTPEAKEALIANSIPQTATITRSEAKLTVEYDGEPSFAPVPGTSMRYAINTSAAVVKISEHDYYCVEAGVWFKGPSAEGPWVVADTVPSQIYDIPPSSPLYNVTYVKVYDSTPEVVHVGYTPGYYGTVVSASTMTVVYGTGWYYQPHISAIAWYGWPYTYGVGAGFTSSEETGWSLGFGYGYGYGYGLGYGYWSYPWWGPMGYYGCCWYPYYGWGAWGGAAVANVYGAWGNTAYSRTAAAWADPYTGNYGAATRGVYRNAQTDRGTLAGRALNANIYTGQASGYRAAATYNPNTGIVTGGGSGFVGNIYTGQGIGGRGGFAYNTNNNAGIAAGKNNVFAGKDGTVYRYNRESGSWSVNRNSGWQRFDKPQPTLQTQQQMRDKGVRRNQNFNSMRGLGVRARVGGRRR